MNIVLDCKTGAGLNTGISTNTFVSPATALCSLSGRVEACWVCELLRPSTIHRCVLNRKAGVTVRTCSCCACRYGQVALHPQTCI